jgi:hypothetical protein
MRRIFKTVSILMFCGAMMFPTTLEARGRNNGGGNGGNGGNGGGTPTATVRQSNQSRQSGVSNNRSNNSSNRQNNNSGMSNGNNRTNNNNVGVSNRNNNNRPNNGNVSNGNRPGNMGGMQQNNRHSNGGRVVNNRPTNLGNMRGGHEVRHNIRPYSRPTPPPAHYRPYAGWPVFRSILGVALGTTIDMTLNALLNNGYAVASYGNNMVYLTDVPMLNMTWNDATLYYGTGGGLIGSEFMYCTPAYNVTRYNAAYAALIRTYGQPYSIQELDGNGMRAVWWGPSNQYIQLSFQGSALNGVLNYCTTLSFGN